MSDILSQVGGFLGSGPGKGVLGAGAAGGGLIQNWLANRQAEKKQKFVEDLITNPQKFQQFVAGFQKPLTAGLTADVSRQADAYGAERGLGSSPAVMKDVYAQALAPSVMSQENAATQAALQSLGIYEGSPTTKPVDISSIIKALSMRNNPAATNPNLFADIGTDMKQPGYMPGGGPDVPPPDTSSFLSGPLPDPMVG